MLPLGLSGLLLLVSQHHLMSHLVFGAMFAPEVPRGLTIVVNSLLGTMLLTVFSQLMLDIVTGIRALLRRRRTTAPAWARYTIGLLALGLAGFGVHQAIGSPPVRQVDITIHGLDPAFDGFRLVQLTDLHLSRLLEAPWTQAVVRDTNALNPDLISITGDLIDGTITARRRDVKPLGDLRAAHSGYVIPGNHEYYFCYPDWMTRFEELGLKTLANNHAIIERGGAILVLAEVTDLTALRTGFPGPDPQQAMAGAPTALSSSWTINPGMPRSPRWPEWRCNCQGIPMAAWSSAATVWLRPSRTARLGKPAELR